MLKAGSSTIKYELFWKPILGILSPEQISIIANFILGYQSTSSLEPYKDFFKFTVLRDPYTRFMSAYFYCIHKKYRKTFDVHRALGIKDWPDEILNDPNKFIHHVNEDILSRDPHTALQTHLLPKDLSELDFIGQLENMEEVENKLSQVLNSEIKFDLFMKKQEKDYFPLKVDADRFNQIFMEDYERLNKFYKPLNAAWVIC